MSEKDKLKEEIARLEKEIQDEVAKGEACMKDCAHLKELVSKVMTTKSAEGVDVELPEDSEDEAPRRRRKAEKEKAEKAKAEPPAKVEAPAPAPPAKEPAPAKPVSKEDQAAQDLRKKLREAKTASEFEECKTEAERIGLKHEAAMATRKIAQLK